MNYLSTRGAGPVDLIAAIRQGIAADGGLFLPGDLPVFEPGDLAGRVGLPDLGAAMLAPFFDASSLAPRLGEICRDALNFPVPLVPLETGRLSLLELFHGPTAAFKDIGARFLAACIERAPGSGPLTILVATSGDTGSAVAAAFHRRSGIRVFILYPRGQVSPRQEQQLCCWSENVVALSVDGPFDTCQRLVKEAFADDALRQQHSLSSANSINIGRLLPQMVYYAEASLAHWNATGKQSSFVVPTGNLGNALACIWARHIGLPIDRIVLATNANRPIPDYLDSGEWQPRDSIPTLASAMDVGNPSNMERLRHLIPDVERLRGVVSASSVDDERIRAQITWQFERRGRVLCPHTATAMQVYEDLPTELRRGRHWIVVATAHPAKFDTIIEPLLGQTLPVPPALAKLLSLPSHSISIDADIGSVAVQLG